MSSSSTLDFKCALVTGGGGGIGKALAQWLIKQGKDVIIAGRTESKLRDAADEMGAKAYYTLDTGDLGSLKAFAEKLVKEHPELDCLINNAGVQRPLDVHELDLEKADAEVRINIQGPVHLAVHLLSHLKSKPSAVIVNVTSVLGYNPFSIINPIYNGTKAFAHMWTMNLRTQLKDTHIKVVEIAPPTVATDLHRERDNPDDNKKENNPNALSLDEFMEYVEKGFKEGKETIGAGMSVEIVDKWFDAYGEAYTKAADAYGEK